MSIAHVVLLGFEGPHGRLVMLGFGGKTGVTSTDQIPAPSDGIDVWITPQERPVDDDVL